MTFSSALDIMKTFFVSSEMLCAMIASIAIVRIFIQSSREHRKTRSKVYELSLFVAEQRRLIVNELRESKVREIDISKKLHRLSKDLMSFNITPIKKPGRPKGSKNSSKKKGNK